jgi:hypothetical protein
MNIEEPRYLLTIGSDAKTVKGEKHNYLTGIHYALPHREVYAHKWAAKLLHAAGIDNFNACQWATTCKDPCLNTAGRGRFSTTQTARAKRTVFRLLRYSKFRLKLVDEVYKLVCKARRRNMTPCVRPNGTTDEDYGWLLDRYLKLIPDLQFYDYSKSLRRCLTNTRSNYHLTYSFDGTKAGHVKAGIAMKHGINVAKVYKGELPNYDTVAGKTIYVLDGDKKHGDLRFLDPPIGMIVGLRAKGRAKKENLGFAGTLAE